MAKALDTLARVTLDPHVERRCRDPGDLRHSSDGKTVVNHVLDYAQPELERVTASVFGIRLLLRGPTTTPR
jgi:hypothetical protein